MDHDPTEPAEDHREGEAVTNARRRLALLAETVGTRHVEYASGLNQLALLLIMQGAPGAAEPLLREALEVRREKLGEEHPDYATNLSSLGGLLWARGALDEAAPLLKRAAEVRVATLGAKHPKTIVSLNSLEQLEAARQAEARPAPAEAPVAPLARPVVTGQVAPGGSDEGLGLDGLTDELDDLSEEFAALGERLTGLAERLRAGQASDDDDALVAAAYARRRFLALSGRVGESAAVMGVALPPGGVTSLHEAAGLLPMLIEGAAARRRASETRRQAANVLRQVESLTCPAEPSFPGLEACRGQARSLRERLEAASDGALPDEAQPLLLGTHACCALLGIVSAADSTGDEQWAEWYEAVEGAFGSSLAVAAARGRIAPAAL